jgi:hypothetical protein
MGEKFTLNITFMGRASCRGIMSYIKVAALQVDRKTGTDLFNSEVACRTWYV